MSSLLPTNTLCLSVLRLPPLLPHFTLLIWRPAEQRGGSDRARVHTPLTMMTKMHEDEQRISNYSRTEVNLAGGVSAEAWAVSGAAVGRCLRWNSGKLLCLWISHLYSCLSHRVAILAVFAVPWIFPKPPLCVCQKCSWMVAYFTVQCNC